MNADKLDDIKRSANVYGCVECGRCVAACPMVDMYVNFSIEMSPRGVIKKALMGDDLVRDGNIWYCTECNAGTDVCPQGVSCRDLIRGLRQIAVEEDVSTNFNYCASCHNPFVPLPAETFVRKRLKSEPENVLDVLNLCPACRRENYMMRNA
ncbi:MAG: 4Fe-4S dicluster domain-containing protein [Deltaproteobacteria bacterium]|nr:4Fe-4S dicluster domain-containing protein [Deltaproteobacteria bacterium]